MLNKQKFSSVLPLTILSLVCVSVIFLVHHFTKEKISINKEQAALKVITEVLSIDYDNDLFRDKIEVDVPVYISNTNKITVFRARQNDQPVGLSLMPVTTKGYNGFISLVIGITYDGKLMGIKIINHNETDGFGNQAHQDNSDWLLGFNEQSLETPEKEWAIKKDDGKFDQLSGATITSRSIINVIYKTLEYYKENQEKFYQ